MKNLTLILILSFLLSFISAISAQDIIGDVDIKANHNLLGQIPNNVQNIPEVIISRSQYVISYNRTKREMNWASWRVSPSSLGHSGRVGQFAVDPDLENYLSTYSEHAVGPTDYRGTCYDRGHQIPSGDRTSSPQANNEVFLMSNMIPQTAFLNKGAWENLESHIRDRVSSESLNAYVIAGPIFDQDFGAIGPNHDIVVPSKNFKIVIFLDPDQTISDITPKTEVIAVVMPNILSSGKAPTEDRKELCDEAKKGPPIRTSWQEYKSTITKIETLSGFKFPALEKVKR